MANFEAIAPGISFFKKQRLLLGLTNTELMDGVLHRLLPRLGMALVLRSDPQTSVFVETNRFDKHEYVAVICQTGNFKLVERSEIEDLARRLDVAATKALEVDRSFKVSRFLVCVSGTYNEKAKAFLQESQVGVSVSVLGGTELVTLIDSNMPEYWTVSDINAYQYFRNLRNALSAAEDIGAEFRPTTLLPSLGATPDRHYVDIDLVRTRLRPKTLRGKISLVETTETIPSLGLLSRRDALTIILGDAGSGKSTILKRLVVTLAQRAIDADSNAVLPFYLKATELSELTRDVEQSLAASYAHFAGSREAPFPGIKFRENGTSMIFVDALDEIAENEKRDYVLQRLAEFTQDNGGVRVIITSRNYAAIRELSSAKLFHDFRIKPMNLSKATALVRKLTEGSKNTEAIHGTLQRLTQVHGLELNPLLIVVFVATSEFSQNDIPANITELFKKFTELMLGRWDEAKGFSQQYQAPLKDFILQSIAFTMHDRRVTQISVTEFEELVATFLEKRGLEADCERLVDEILLRSGLLVINGSSVEFRHHLIQEFFAGRGIKEPNFIRKNIFDDWWRAAIVFYFGERPYGGAELCGALDESASHDSSEILEAALTLGQALQACYLAEIPEKRNVFTTVIQAISESDEAVRAMVDKTGKFPYLTKIAQYFIARDSVSLSALSSFATELFHELDPHDPLENAQRFWILVGLLHSGGFEIAQELINDFDPQDRALWVPLDVACFYEIEFGQMNNERKAKLKNLKKLTSKEMQGMVPAVIDEISRGRAMAKLESSESVSLA